MTPDDSILTLISGAIKGGYGIPIILWFLWDKKRERDEKIDIKEKKAKGEYVSFHEVKSLKEQFSIQTKLVETASKRIDWNETKIQETAKIVHDQMEKESLASVDLGNKIERMIGHHSKLDNIVSVHLEDEKKEDIRMAKNEARLDFMEKNTEKIEKSISDIFRIMSEIKDRMIERAK